MYLFLCIICLNIFNYLFNACYVTCIERSKEIALYKNKVIIINNVLDF